MRILTMSGGMGELLGDAFSIADLGRQTCSDALDSDEPDFEDGIVRSVAERCGCDFIISRDETAFASSSVRRLSASDYLAMS